MTDFFLRALSAEDRGRTSLFRSRLLPAPGAFRNLFAWIVTLTRVLLVSNLWACSDAGRPTERRESLARRTLRTDLWDGRDRGDIFLFNLLDRLRATAPRFRDMTGSSVSAFLCDLENKA